ncbi:MAG: SDR family oxidoreductase [Saprospiraceae bacterium]|nr:SDR family oxidoreductase [Saprospiraceae bacterium]
MNLKDKTALVTGASSGIGKSFAYLLASKGAHLVLVARTQAKLEEIANDIQNTKQVSVHVYQKDLSQLNAASELYEQLQKDQIDIDLLVNNAGYGKWGKFENFSLEEYGKMIQLNVTSLMELCHLYVEDFREKPAAGIINVGSTASFIPVPYSSVYAATKSFVLNFTEGLVGELSETNIKVFCLCPGGTASNFATVANESGVDNAQAKLMSSDEVAQLGLDAFLAGKHYIVTGRRFQLILFKFLSRKRVLSMIADYWRKRLGL